MMKKNQDMNTNTFEGVEVKDMFGVVDVVNAFEDVEVVEIEDVDVVEAFENVEVDTFEDAEVFDVVEVVDNIEKVEV